MLKELTEALVDVLISPTLPAPSADAYTSGCAGWAQNAFTVGAVMPYRRLLVDRSTGMTVAPDVPTYSIRSSRLRITENGWPTPAIDLVIVLLATSMTSTRPLGPFAT